MLEHDLVREAQHLARNPALEVIFDRLTRRYADDIINSPPNDAAGRETAYRMIRAVQALRDEVKSVAMSKSIEEWNRRLRGTQV